MSYQSQAVIGPYWTGDIEHQTATITVEDAYGSEVDLSGFVTAAPVVTAPDGTIAAGFTAAISASDVIVTFPTTSQMTLAGIYSLQVTLTGTAAHIALTPVLFVVQAEDGWHTLDSIRWALGGDFTSNDAQAFTLLEIAKEQVISFAPPIGFASDGVTLLPVPIRYKQAQLMQARNILNTVKTDPSSTADSDAFVIRPYPLDNFIKAILRPKKGVPKFS